jgi:hypothetical protein
MAKRHPFSAGQVNAVQKGCCFTPICPPCFLPFLLWGAVYGKMAPFFSQSGQCGAKRVLIYPDLEPFSF